MRALAALVALLAVGLGTAASPPGQGDSRFNFGEVRQGRTVEHEFALRNDGDTPLRISGVRLSPALRLERMPATIPPGGSARLHVSLDTARVSGDYRGVLAVNVDGSASPREFAIEGRVVPPIEIRPLAAFFVSTTGGNAKSATLEVVNHERAPLDVAIERRPAVGDVSLEAVEPGRRYRLTLAVAANSPIGISDDRIELRTSDPLRPRLRVAVHVIVNGRVHTFPEAVDLGTVRLRDLRVAGPAPNGLSQTLMIYQAGGRDFRVTPSTNVPALEVTAQRGPRGDRVQLTVSLDASKAAAGPIDGAIVVTTNDPRFPRVTVPVYGVILAD